MSFIADICDSYTTEQFGIILEEIWKKISISELQEHFLKEAHGNPK